MSIEDGWFYLYMYIFVRLHYVYDFDYMRTICAYMKN